MKWRRSERIADQAARWVVLIDSADFNASEAARFQSWIGRSETHRSAFLLASETWSELDALPKLKAYPKIMALLEAPSLPHAQGDASGLDRRVLLAGTGLGVLGVGLLGYNVLAPRAAEAFETGIGEQREVSLSDGTRVFLNAGTRLEARLASGRRNVRLLSGEAYFVVAPDLNAPLLIQTRHGLVEASSGELLVKLLPDGVRVALMSENARTSRRRLIGDGEFVAVSARSEIVFDHGGMAIAATSSEQLSRRTLWRQGMLAFEDTPLAEAAADVARQTGVRFVFADPALAELRVGGLIQCDDLQAFLKLLRHNLAIDAERRGDEILLSSTATL